MNREYGTGSEAQHNRQPRTQASGLLRLKRWGPLVALLAAMAALYASGALEFLSLASIAEHREALQALVDKHWIGALVAYALVYAAVIALSVPVAALLTILGGLLFGWYVAAPVTVTAATAGASILFLIARTSFGDVLFRRAGPRLKRLAEGFRGDAFNYLLFLRLVPVFPFWLVNIAPALINMPLKTYLAATFLGIMPGTVAYAFVGSGLDSIIAAQRHAYEQCLAERGAEACEFSLDAESLLTGEMIAALVALGIAALIPVALRRLGPRRERQSPAAK